MKAQNKNILALFLIICVYTLLTLISANNGYFWDNIQLVSIQAHRFYDFGFKLLFSTSVYAPESISATGYHPPLIGLITAGLWKIFSYKLWVSHVFTFILAIILIFNLWKLLKMFFEEKFLGWVLMIVLLEASLLTQFAIVSPDFFLFTAFIISLRGILERKQWLTAIGVFFLCFVSMRGVFAGVILYLVHVVIALLHNDDTNSKIKIIFKKSLPFLPAFILLIFYYSFYLYLHGWFFTHNPSYSEHYILPQNVAEIVKHFAEFVLRSVENGRIIIWILGVYTLIKILNSKEKLMLDIKFLFWLFVSLNSLYIVFIFISRMPFSARYFIPQFFLLTLLTLWGVIRFVNNKKHIQWVFILILLFELTGHCWIYPEKIAKSWENTLAHLPYYQLRNECFNYIDQKGLNYADISAGFCLYGNRKFVEMKNEDKIVGNEPIRKYFIYSNISNLNDSLLNDLNINSHWKPLKKFQSGFVKIILYQNLKISGENK
ncbi:MAG: hypothetical protein Q7U47_04600 [Paludibacter sp.]|nr:hypothetical protein [Paludibacter sp.]